MKRRNFLKYLGIGGATIAIAPALLANSELKPIEIKPVTKIPEYKIGPGILEQIELASPKEREFVFYTGRKGRDMFYEAIKGEAYSWDMKGADERKIW